MDRLVLFCKSYRDDVLRAEQMVRSVERFNSDGLELYVSVPSADRSLFEENLAGLACNLLNDDEIISANPALDQKVFGELSGGIAQQVVKSEFWRLSTLR